LRFGSSLTGNLAAVEQVIWAPVSQRFFPDAKQHGTKQRNQNVTLFLKVVFEGLVKETVEGRGKMLKNNLRGYFGYLENLAEKQVLGTHQCRKICLTPLQDILFQSALF